MSVVGSQNLTCLQQLVNIMYFGLNLCTVMYTFNIYLINIRFAKSF